MALPFICAGQARAGTTWLSQVFSASPEYFAPPLKEWNYLSALAYTGHALSFNELLENSIAQQALFYNHQLSSFAGQFRALSQNQLNNKDVREHLKWWRAFLFSDFNLSTYAALFSTNDKPTFDISPEYCLIPAQFLASALATIPGLRIVVLLRHPPSRFRSHLSLLKTTGQLTIATQEEIDHIDHHGKASDLVAGILSLIVPNQVFIGFADDIRFHEERFLSALTAFLDTGPLIAPSQRINASEWKNAPPKNFPAAHLFAAEMQRLNTLLPRKWPAFWTRVPANIFDTDDEYRKEALKQPFCSGPLLREECDDNGEHQP